eukprot:scaffold126952_cov69-Phaeocystis_antarctica.AAC.1
MLELAVTVAQTTSHTAALTSRPAPFSAPSPARPPRTRTQSRAALYPPRTWSAAGCAAHVPLAAR